MNITEQFKRFFLVGGINTIITLCLFWGLLSVIGHHAAYAITFVFGILISWALNSKQTFRTNLNWYRLPIYALFYLISWAIGQSALLFLTDVSGIAPHVAILGVILITLPVNFFGSRLILLHGLQNQPNLTRRDFKRIAELHMEALPSSITSRLGKGVTIAFYRFVSCQSHDFIEVLRDDKTGNIIACAMVAKDLDKTFKKLKRDMEFLLMVAINAWRVPLKTLIGGDNTSEENLPQIPELVYLFTDAQCRSSGHGKQLLRKIEKRLALIGEQQYYVKTEGPDTARAMKFYKREGFTFTKEITVFGAQYNLLTKTVTNSFTNSKNNTPLSHVFN